VIRGSFSAVIKVKIAKELLKDFNDSSQGGVVLQSHLVPNPLLKEKRTNSPLLEERGWG
jgi:hypothetical protein